MNNPIALIMMSIFAKKYYVSYKIVTEIGSISISEQDIKQLQLFVDFFESQLYSGLRFELIIFNSSQEYILRTLYSILMIIPQVSSTVNIG